MGGHSGRAGSADAGLDLGGAHKGDDEFDKVRAQSDRLSNSSYEYELHDRHFIMDDDDLSDADCDMGSYILDLYWGSERELEDECNDPSLPSTADPTAETTTTDATLARRREQSRRSMRKATDRAKAALKLEEAAAHSWRPRRCVSLDHELYMQLNTRWICDQYIRAYKAHHGTENGVNVQQTVKQVVYKCLTKGFAAIFAFDRQPKTGLWKLNRFLEHQNEC